MGEQVVKQERRDVVCVKLVTLGKKEGERQRKRGRKKERK